jgi:hypothetical protein
MELPLAMTLSQNAVLRELHSARPDAPIVPERVRAPRRPRAVRTRTTVAHLLERTAQWVTPTPSCPPLH